MSNAEASSLGRLKRLVQSERRRTANPFIRQRIEDTAEAVFRVEQRLAVIEQRLQDVAAGVQNDTQAVAAVALGLQRDMDQVARLLDDLRQALPVFEPAHDAS